MQNSALIQWLRSLRMEDLEAFGQFLSQPAYAGKRLPAALFAYLMQHVEAWHPQGTPHSAALSESAIHAHLYPKEAVKPQRIRLIMMELRAMVEEFAASAGRPQSM